MTFALQCFRCLPRFIRSARMAARLRNSAHDSLFRACVRLPEPGRSVYLLSARDELGFAEIAVRLDLTVEAVEHELARALLLLSSGDVTATSPLRDR